MAREHEYQLVETCRRLSGLGMMPASDGNCSIRLDETTMLITPTGVRKEQLKPRDLVQVDLESDEASSRVSTEWRMHARIYQRSPEIQALVHAHPAYLTAWGLRGEAPDSSLLFETAETVGPIRIIPAQEPGTEAFAEAVAEALGDAGVAILANHGAVAVGASLEEALFRLERAEHLSQVASLAGR